MALASLLSPIIWKTSITLCNSLIVVTHFTFPQALLDLMRNYDYSRWQLKLKHILVRIYIFCFIHSRLVSLHPHIFLDQCYNNPSLVNKNLCQSKNHFNFLAQMFIIKSLNYISNVTIYYQFFSRLRYSTWVPTLRSSWTRTTTRTRSLRGSTWSLRCTRTIRRILGSMKTKHFLAPNCFPVRITNANLHVDKKISNVVIYSAKSWYQKGAP